MRPPEKLTIDTPEQIALEFPLAGAGSRFLALAIDSFVQIAILAVLGLVGLIALWFRSRGFQSLATWVAATLVLLGFLLYYGYFAAFEALWGGQTPGKRAVGLRVISVTGQPITTFDALLRNLLRIVDQMPGIYAVGVLSIFFTSRNQRLGDLVAGTVVVQEQGLAQADLSSTQVSTTRLGAARLSIEEVEVIQTFLARRSDLPRVPALAYRRADRRPHPDSPGARHREPQRRRSANRKRRRRVSPAMNSRQSSVGSRPSQSSVRVVSRQSESSVRVVSPSRQSESRRFKRLSIRECRLELTTDDSGLRTVTDDGRLTTVD